MNRVWYFECQYMFVCYLLNHIYTNPIEDREKFHYIVYFLFGYWASGAKAYSDIIKQRFL